MVKLWTPSPIGPIFFIFIQVLAKFCQIIGWRPLPLRLVPGSAWIRRCLSIVYEMGIACFRNTSSGELIFGRFSPKLHKNEENCVEETSSAPHPKSAIDLECSKKSNRMSKITLKQLLQEFFFQKYKKNFNNLPTKSIFLP